jgi:hypothetical protein
MYYLTRCDPSNSGNINNIYDNMSKNLKNRYYWLGDGLEFLKFYQPNSTHILILFLSLYLKVC